MPLADTIFCKNWPVEPYFSLQLADTITNFEAILAAREEEYKKRFVKCFLNVIYFRQLKNIYSSCVFTVSNFFSQLKHFNLQQFSIISFFLSFFVLSKVTLIPSTYLDYLKYRYESNDFSKKGLILPNFSKSGHLTA